MEPQSPIVIVTGAGSGIGRASCIALAEAGWTVILVGRRETALRETASQAIGADRLIVMPADVTDPSQVESVFKMVKQRFGRLDLLFNNAGVSAIGVPLEEIELHHWQRIVDTNLTGTFLCTQQAVKMMKSQSPRGGRIINNGSVSAHSPRPLSASYTATKHAITGLTKSVALDGRAFNVVCSQIDVGNVATEWALARPGGSRQADGTFKTEPTIDPMLVARAVVIMAGMPLEANIQYLTLIPSAMPYVGRG